MLKGKREFRLIWALVFLGLIFRLFLIKDNHFHFYFDQARDAHISRSIIEEKDLKIQGPSASGTNDILYHGVLYYYLIGPVYTISGGNPAIVSLFLSLLSSLTIIPIFLLSKAVFNNKTIGYLASFLYALSIDAAEIGSCLANPSLATLTIPWLYLFIYKTFYKKQDKYLPLVALALGLTNQAAIWTIYLFIPLLFFYVYRAVKEKKIIIFDKKNLMISFFIYFLSIASIIITQVKLYSAGIFTLNAIRDQMQHNVARAAKAITILHPYIEKITYSIWPTWPTLSLIIFIVITVWFLAKTRFKNPAPFLIIWFLSPVLLSFRTFYYMLAGILPVIYLLIAFVGWNLGKSRWGKIIVGVFIIVFSFSNIIGIRKSRAKEYTKVVNIQKGAYLYNQLKLIDQTYKIASGEEFSISSLTSPYKYNTTWSYLYSWYGKKKYGYTPAWFGPSQVGIPAGELLKEVNQPKEVHFAIYDPDPGWLFIFIPEFDQEQTSWTGSPSAVFEFGALKLEQR